MTTRKVNSRLQQTYCKEGKTNLICCAMFSCIVWSLICGKNKFLVKMIKQCNRAADIFLVNDWSCTKMSQSFTLTNHLNSIIPCSFKITSSIFKRGCWL